MGLRMAWEKCVEFLKSKRLRRTRNDDMVSEMRAGPLKSRACRRIIFLYTRKSESHMIVSHVSTPHSEILMQIVRTRAREWGQKWSQVTGCRHAPSPRRDEKREKRGTRLRISSLSPYSPSHISASPTLSTLYFLFVWAVLCERTFGHARNLNV